MLVVVRLSFLVLIVSISVAFMSNIEKLLKRMSKKHNVPEGGFTTNEEDQRKAAELKERLVRESKRSGGGVEKLPSVKVAEGAHKYVLIKAQFDGEEQYFVTSKRGAHYHRNAAEPMIYELEQAGYDDIEVTGGGRIALDTEAKTMSIFGYSYGFGQADHSISKRVVEADERFADFDVTISNEGY